LAIPLVSLQISLRHRVCLHPGVAARDLDRLYIDRGSAAVVLADRQRSSDISESERRPALSIYFIFAPLFAKAFDNWMISLLLWMSPWAGVVLADFFIKRRSRIDVAELYRAPDVSAYGDINWSVNSDPPPPGQPGRHPLRRYTH
jgi:Permease for cytosine/purines, uracil, thiamine, allantoin